MTCSQDQLLPVQAEQPRTSTRNLGGRPRGDTRVLAVLRAEEWTTAAVVAERLGLSLKATYVALWRAEQRGLIEHRWRRGYRVRGAA